MAAKAPKLTTSKKSGDVTLSGDRFTSDFNEHLVWHVVRNEMLWRRQGTHATRNRALQRGGGAKPWRQKGTGRARQGSRRSPQWAGGATVFGPQPRKYGGKVNAKERVAAFNAAWSLHASRGTMGVIAESFDTPSTKQARSLIETFNADRVKTTVVVCADETGLIKSFRNLRDVIVVIDTDIDVADLMWGRQVLVTEAAFESLTGKDKS